MIAPTANRDLPERFPGTIEADDQDQRSWSCDQESGNTHSLQASTVPSNRTSPACRGALRHRHALPARDCRFPHPGNNLSPGCSRPCDSMQMHALSPPSSRRRRPVDSTERYKSCQCGETAPRDAWQSKIGPLKTTHEKSQRKRPAITASIALAARKKDASETDSRRFPWGSSPGNVQAPAASSSASRTHIRSMESARPVSGQTSTSAPLSLTSSEATSNSVGRNVRVVSRMRSSRRPRMPS